jgi:hypothetical protein
MVHVVMALPSIQFEKKRECGMIQENNIHRKGGSKWEKGEISGPG